MSAPAPLHGQQCRCPQCAGTRKAQYQAYRDGAQQPTATDHWARRTTAPQQVEAGLEMSLRFLSPLKARNVELLEAVAARDYIILALLHATNDLRDDIDCGTWPDRIYSDTLTRLKALADEDNERKATRT